MRAGVAGQFGAAGRAVCQAVGDAELGRGVDGARYVHSPDHAEDGRRGSALLVGGRRVARAGIAGTARNGGLAAGVFPDGAAHYHRLQVLLTACSPGLVTAGLRSAYCAPSAAVSAAYTRLVQRRPRPVEFKILGDTQVLADGQPLGIGGPKTRAVLALLAVNAGKIVAADVLQEELWPGLLPARAAANLQVRMSELRGALRAAGLDQRLVRRPPGYLLR